MRMKPLFQIDNLHAMTKSNCKACGLDKFVHTPNMQMHGEGKERILLIGEGPGQNEDAVGYQFYEGAKAGGRLHRTMGNHGINIIRDCFTINAVNCRPHAAGHNRTPTAVEVAHCRPNMLKAIETAKARAIFLFGAIAIESFLADKSATIRRTHTGDEKGKASTIAVWRGLRWPDLQHNAWVYPMLHPAYIERFEHYAHIFNRDMACALAHVRGGFKIPTPNYKNAVEILLHVPDIVSFLKNLARESVQISIDFETNMLDPHHDKAELLTAAICQISGREAPVYKSVAFPVDMLPDAPDRNLVKSLLKDVLLSDTPKVFHNFQMEEKWARWLGITTHAFVFDTMQAAHIIDERDLYTGLDKQVFLHYGYEYGENIAQYKSGNPINRMRQVPIKDLLGYNGLDALFTAMLSRELIKPLRANPDLFAAYRLWHDGTRAFSVMESVGIPVNVEYFQDRKAELKAEMETLNKKVLHSPEVAKFFDKYRRYPNLGKKGSATNDLAILVSDIAGVFVSLDEAALSTLNNETLNKIIKLRKHNKLLNTYLAAYLNHYNGRIYPNFNLHLTRTLRSSSDKPNFQNIPNRDAEARALVRRGICPPPGYKWATTDYGSHEVRIIAAYFNDPELSRMIHADEDPHGEWCVELGLDKQRPWKDARSDTKNAVVFPWFYGSWYRAVHADLVSRGYDISESKVQRAEQLFWTKYAVTRRGQEELIYGYERTGYVPMLFGHRRGGILSKNQIINAAIQGSAFHCLLWAAKHAIDMIEHYNLKTQIPGQIHDEIVSFIWPDEEEFYIRELTRIMEEDVRQFNKRITVPLLAEWAVGAVDAPWLDKKAIPPKEMEVYLAGLKEQTG